MVMMTDVLVKLLLEIYDGDRVSEYNSLGSKPLDRLEDDVRGTKLSCVHRPMHLDPVKVILINIHHLGCLRLLKDGNVFRGEKEKVKTASFLG